MKDNAIKLYKHFCEMVEKPVGADSLERDLCRKTCLKNKENMERHFRSAHKYRGDMEILALLEGMTIEEYQEKLKKEEVKSKGKK